MDEEWKAAAEINTLVASLQYVSAAKSPSVFSSLLPEPEEIFGETGGNGKSNNRGVSSSSVSVLLQPLPLPLVRLPALPALPVLSTVPVTCLMSSSSSSPTARSRPGGRAYKSRRIFLMILGPNLIK